MTRQLEGSASPSMPHEALLCGLVGGVGLAELVEDVLLVLDDRLRTCEGIRSTWVEDHADALRAAHCVVDRLVVRRLLLRRIGVLLPRGEAIGRRYEVGLSVHKQSGAWCSAGARVWCEREDVLIT